jgi:putative copper resistance protein D
MPVDTFTGLILSYATPGTPGLPPGPRPAWAGTGTGDLHAAGAVMWVGGDGLMFVLMMVIFLMWSTDTKAASRRHGWLESARRATVAPDAGSARADIDEDDEQLAAYNAYLGRLNDAGRPH